MNKRSSFRILRISLLGFFTPLALAACLVGGLALNALYLQHERAAARWNQRQPHHYQYTLHIHSSFWRSSFQIEILNGEIMRTIDLRTGQPARLWEMAPGSYMHETGMLWNYMIIDRIFDLIEAARRPPKSMAAFLTRLNPGWYYALAYQGLLPYERTSCDPAFPRVSYNSQYGYPEELVLGSNPCTTVMELSAPVSIRIEAFQILP